MPSNAPGSVTPLISRTNNMMYGNVAVTYTTCKYKFTDLEYYFVYRGKCKAKHLPTMVTTDYYWALTNMAIFLYIHILCILYVQYNNWSGFMHSQPHDNTFSTIQ